MTEFQTAPLPGVALAAILGILFGLDCLLEGIAGIVKEWRTPK